MLMRMDAAAELNSKIDDAIRARVDAEYNEGLRAGLQVAEKIRDWLTSQPDTKWQRRVRELADLAIAEANRDLLR